MSEVRKRKRLSGADQRKKNEFSCRSPHCSKGCVCEGYCTNCGGQMTWCSSCDMWTETCCDTYGTCACS